MNRVLNAQNNLAVQEDVTRRTGLSFAGARGPQLASIVNEVAVELGVTKAAGLTGDEATFDRLCEALTVQESFFFREPAGLALIREHIVPGFREHRAHVRLWSAGCARGEEAYTLSMLLAGAGLAGRYRVLGTDLSAAAVASAERAEYGRWAVRGLGQRAVASYFEGGTEGLRVAEPFRSRVTFAQHNLLEPLPSDKGPFDLVLCRNVLIYFTPDAVRRAAEALTAALAPGGWLLLGVSDPPLGDVAGLQKVTTARGPVYRRLDAPPVPAPEETSAPTRIVDAPAPGRTATSLRRSPAPVPVSGPPVPAPGPDSRDLVAAAELALAMADAPEAVTLARKALERSPQEPSVHQLMVQALAEDGRTQDSLVAANLALSRFPEDHRIRELQAVVLLETGQAGPAVSAARKAVYLDPGSASAHFVLARAHELLGDVDAARRARRNGRVVAAGQVQP